MATARIFNHHIHTAFYRLALVDGLLFFGAFYLGAYLYFLPEPDRLHSYLDGAPIRATTFAVIAVTSLFAMGLYQPRLREGGSGVLLRTTGAFALTALAMSAMFYALPDLHLWRGN